MTELIARVSALEKSNTELQSVNDLLKTEIKELKTLNTDLHVGLKQLETTVSLQQKSLDQLELSSTAAERGTSIEQERLNCNVVVRGVECSEETSEEQLFQTFNKICTFIGIEKEEELIPLHAEVLKSEPIVKSKTLIFKLKSVDAKRAFLLARRTKFDIKPTDIKLTQSTNNPLVITEQLTRRNQDLLYKARALRDTAGFKYVWSSNGQILARKQNRHKVIRILDVNQIEQLQVESQSQLNLNSYGPTDAPRYSRTSSSDPQI